MNCTIHRSDTRSWSRRHYPGEQTTQWTHSNGRSRSLDQKVRVLERKAELDNETTQTKSQANPRLTAGADGFSFSSADTNFVLKLRGYVQTDARFYLGDNIPANDTFLMRRVRPIIEGTVYKYYDYRIMLDFASGIRSSAIERRISAGRIFERALLASVSNPGG